MKREVIAIAGLPGSGKTTLLLKFNQQGYHGIDDINKDWSEGINQLRQDLQRNAGVVVTDIIFCDPAWRQRLEAELGMPVRWVFFANSPWRCALNCCSRFMWQAPDRPVLRELKKIWLLSRRYVADGEPRPVPKAPWFGRALYTFMR